jgi:hypothetical protein
MAGGTARVAARTSSIFWKRGHAADQHGPEVRAATETQVERGPQYVNRTAPGLERRSLQPPGDATIRARPTPENP